MIKLYNFSPFSDEVLVPVLNLAKSSLPCHGNVIVKVTRGGWYVHSMARPCDYVSKAILSKTKKTKSGKNRKGWVNTDGGYVILSPGYYEDSLLMATEFFKVAVHEFAHVRDFQRKEKFTGYNKRWKNRPHERRAIHATDDTMEKVRKNSEIFETYNKVILNLALEIEKTGIIKTR